MQISRRSFTERISVGLVACLLGGCSIEEDTRNQESVQDPEDYCLPICFESEFSPFNGIAESLPEDKIEIVCKKLSGELNKYPENFVTNNLTEVFIFNSFIFQGNKYGGTYLYNDSGRAYVLVVYEEISRHPKSFGRAFHHEFSSILLDKNPNAFDRLAWEAINPEGFCYLDVGGKGRNLLGKFENSLDGSDELYEQGFLCKYAQSCVENDFEEFAGKMFCGGKEFWSNVQKSDRLNQKLELMLGFYHALDSRFTLDYFKEVSVR